jgi:hypothetical protein
MDGTEAGIIPGIPLAVAPSASRFCLAVVKLARPSKFSMVGRPGPLKPSALGDGSMSGPQPPAVTRPRGMPAAAACVSAADAAAAAASSMAAVYWGMSAVPRGLSAAAEHSRISRSSAVTGWLLMACSWLQVTMKSCRYACSQHACQDSSILQLCAGDT